MVGGDGVNSVAVVGEEEPLDDEEMSVVDEGEREPRPLGVVVDEVADVRHVEEGEVGLEFAEELGFGVVGGVMPDVAKAKVEVGDGLLSLS